MTQVALVAPDQILHVRDEKTAGTAGGSSSAGDNIRVLNTVVRNTISGASLASNQITLPLGTYTCTASAPCVASSQTRARLVNVTDTTVTLLGQGAYSLPASVMQLNCLIIGTFTITAAKVFNITHFFVSARATDGLGADIGDARTNIFTEVFITKIA